MARFHTTVTERSGFRSCRRQWYLEVIERLGHKDRVGWAVEFGECIHKGLEAYYRQNKRSVRSALTAFDRQWSKTNDELLRKYGTMYTLGIGDEWYEWRDKGRLMLTYYKIYDDDPKQFDFDKVLAVNIEARAFVDILNPHTEERLEGLPLLSGRIDLVAERKDGIYIWDHKTTQNVYNARALDIDDQGTGYCYIFWRTTGVIPRGFVHNGLIKEPPKTPKILQSGKLSQDKAQRTTIDLYLKAIKENDLDEDDYEEMIEFLKEKSWSQFYNRDVVIMNEEQLLSFEERLYYEWQDMTAVIEDPVRAYPNPTQYYCPGCSVLPICQAMEERGDAEYLKETMFEVQPVRAQIPKAILSDKWKGV